jgi:hypothetical protein
MRLELLFDFRSVLETIEKLAAALDVPPDELGELRKPS